MDSQETVEERLVEDLHQTNQRLNNELEELKTTVNQQQLTIEKYETLFVRINNTIADYKEIQSTG